MQSVECGRVLLCYAERFHPGIGYRYQVRINSAAYLLQERGQGITVVFVFAQAKTIAFHYDSLTEMLWLIVLVDQDIAFRFAEYITEDCITIVMQVIGGVGPVKCLYSFGDRIHYPKLPAGAKVENPILAELGGGTYGAWC